MITRQPLTYTTPAQIVRLWHYGFNVPMPVYLYALSQVDFRERWIPAMKAELNSWTTEERDEMTFFEDSLERSEKLASDESKAQEWSNR